MAGFGTSFGRLVREKRGAEGLSQEELAFQAGLAKARISDLENAKIGNPQAKTVDALCVALNITREERARCHEGQGPPKPPPLPPLLLENLALRFGHSNPEALEGDLVAFLKQQAVAFSEMKARLAKIDAVGSAVARLVAEASAALDRGEFEVADARLAQAENEHLAAATVPALESQYRLRAERGNAALLAGDVKAAAGHLEAAARYFHFFDAGIEAERRYEGTVLLREYAYRFRNAEALYAAETALRKNLESWTRSGSLRNWSKAMNALGGVYWRLSQYDDLARFDDHLAAAKAAYTDVHDHTSSAAQPYFHAISGGNLANIFSDSAYSKDGEAYSANLKRALALLESAAKAIRRETFPTDWGIFQHNLGCTYIKVFSAQPDPGASLDLINRAAKHLELSFRVRDPEDSLQYWIASCRSLAEALITRAPFLDDSGALKDLQRARQTLSQAFSAICEAEHPNQWRDLEAQRDRLVAGTKVFVARDGIAQRDLLALRPPAFDLNCVNTYAGATDGWSSSGDLLASTRRARTPKGTGRPSRRT